MRIFLTILLLTSAITDANTEKPDSSKNRLFLVGGALKTCSSMSNSHCKNPHQGGKTSPFFRIDSDHIKQFNQRWPKRFEPKNRLKIAALLQTISHKSTPNNLNKAQLKQLISDHDNQGLVNTLSDPEYYFLLDSLEIAVTKDNARHKEAVYLDDSTNPFSVELYRKFVAYAAKISGKATPTILVVTASARDPFEAVDFYLDVFKQAGADSQWLAVDASLQATWRQTDQRPCASLETMRNEVQGNAFRAQVYPDLAKQQLNACLEPQRLQAQVAAADGIFINGGDQSLTVQAFKDNQGNDFPLMAQIREKVMQGKLIVGGTSAGTAVMSGRPMITNGTSEVALVRGAKADVLPTQGCQKSNRCKKNILNDDLTYRSAGGLGLFSWGIMDTHFSERGRQGRLAKLLLQSDNQFAFGVDETTAMLVSWADHNNQSAQMTILGQGGVFVVEKTANTLLTHYLTRDDQATLADGQLNLHFAPWKSSINVDAPIPPNNINVFEHNRYQLLTELLCRTNNQRLNASSSWNNHTITLMISKTASALSGYGAVRFGEKRYDYCSYKNYQLTWK